MAPTDIMSCVIQQTLGPNISAAYAMRELHLNTHRHQSILEGSEHGLKIGSHRMVEIGMCGHGLKTKSYCVECMRIPSGWKCPTPGCARDIFWRHQEDPSFDEKCTLCYRFDVLRAADAIQAEK